MIMLTLDIAESINRHPNLVIFGLGSLQCLTNSDYLSLFHLVTRVTSHHVVQEAVAACVRAWVHRQDPGLKLNPDQEILNLGRERGTQNAV